MSMPASLHLPEFSRTWSTKTRPGMRTTVLSTIPMIEVFGSTSRQIQRLPRILVGIWRQPIASEETSLKSTPAKVIVVGKMNPWLLMWADALDMTFKRSGPGIQAQRDNWCFKRSGHDVLPLKLKVSLLFSATLVRVLGVREWTCRPRSALLTLFLTPTDSPPYPFSPYVSVACNPPPPPPHVYIDQSTEDSPSPLLTWDFRLTERCRCWGLGSGAKSLGNHVLAPHSSLHNLLQTFFPIPQNVSAHSRQKGLYRVVPLRLHQIQSSPSSHRHTCRHPLQLHYLPEARFRRTTTRARRFHVDFTRFSIRGQGLPNKF